MVSSYDNRYPAMHPVERELPGLTWLQMREARRVGGEVARRTGTRCFYNSASGKLIWVYGDEPHGGPLGVRFRTSGGTIKHYHGGDVDDLVLLVNMGKAKRVVKDRIAAANAASAEHDRKETEGRRLDGLRKDTVDYAEFLSRKRRGTGTLAVTV